MKKRLSILLIAVLLLAGCGKPASQLPNPTGPVSDGNGLTVHFIDVGQADCALLECGGEFMLIDGGNVEDSSLVVSYLEKQGVEELSYVICTHAHEDHVGGLPGVLAVYPTKAVYCSTRTYGTDCFDDFVYYTDQQGLEVTIPAPGDQFKLSEAVITVLGPVDSYANVNDNSIVLLVQFGNNTFFFTGDMETSAENDMLEYWGSNRESWKVDVLKVGHHGSDTSTGYRFLYELDPEYAVISVGEGNKYGHPCEEPLSRLEDAEVTLYRTDKLGTVIAVSDGTDITFSWEKGSAQPQKPAGGEETPQQYIGNKNSKTLHLPTCGSLPAEKNQVLFDSYDEAIAQGYQPCSRCMG